MIGALSLVTAFIFIPFFAHNIVQLLVGLILMGIPWGVFQTLTCTYAAEVCPTGLRAYLTTYVNLCWVIGQFRFRSLGLGTGSGRSVGLPNPIRLAMAVACTSDCWDIFRSRVSIVSTKFDLVPD